MGNRAAFMTEGDAAKIIKVAAANNCRAIFTAHPDGRREVRVEPQRLDLVDVGENDFDKKLGL